MNKSLKKEIDKYLSKKKVYYKKFSNNLKEYLKQKYPGLSSLKARWYMLKNNLTTIPSCSFYGCNNPVKWNERKNVFDKGCCVDHIKRINSLKKFGTEHPSQSKEQKSKVKKSMRKKYGVDFITQTEKHKRSVSETVQEKYGVDSILKVPEIRDKIKKTNLERFGVEECMSSPKIRDKAKKTNLKRYGSEESLASPLIRGQINKTNLERYGSIFPMKNEELLEKRKKTIVEKYDSYSPIKRKEADTKYLNLEKSIEAENNGNTYYLFFEEEVIFKKKQIDWILNKSIKKTINQFRIKKIDYEVRDNFIEQNSLYSADSIIRQNYGFYYNKELLAIISGCERTLFFEITRFVIKIGINFSKNILIEFVEYIGINKPFIISFERRFTSINQDILIDARFDFIGGTEPILRENNIWDCGKLIFKKY